MNNNITALVGAGAVIELGAPKTNEITSIVIDREQNVISLNPYFEEKKPILKEIYNKLENLNAYKGKVNFEHILHTTELLQTLKTGWSNPLNPTLSTTLSPFVQNESDLLFKNNNCLNAAQEDLIEIVANEVSKYNEEFKKNIDQHNWYRDFWRNNKNIWNITNLNYDTTIENSLEEYEDGFEIVNETYSRFNPLKFEESSISTIAHLHGCINYGYPKEILNKYLFEDSFEDLYKMNNFNDARPTWFGRSNRSSQASEQTIRGPIITGLHKLEKTATYPYSHYLYHFQKSIIQNRCLLIVGYGFGDLYLNDIMERMNRIHGNNKRVVIITYYGKEYWSNDHTVTDYPDNDIAYSFLANMLKNEDIWSDYKYDKFEAKEPVKSKDNTCIVYIKGFKEAANEHSEEIFSFFNS
jgi:hypothetical protein